MSASKSTSQRTKEIERSEFEQVVRNLLSQPPAKRSEVKIDPKKPRTLIQPRESEHSHPQGDDKA